MSSNTPRTLYIDGEVFNMLKNLKILKNKWGVRSGRRRRSRKGLAEAYVCNSQGVLNFGRGVNVLNLISLPTEGNFVGFSKNSNLNEFNDCFTPFQNGSNKNNLVEKKSDLNNDKCFTVGCLNAQSVKNKCILISNFIADNQLDMYLITETWLRPENNFIRNECSPTGYIFLNETRGHREGGGVRMICRDIYKPLKLSSGIVNFFEFLECKIQLGNGNIYVFW